ncbi:MULTISPECIES: class I SAM-dependent methyltransferase [Dyella]|uniref:Class I SAM-dependent methyltransferase n=2 Tax=Dyella TaxID=231454 RepID=A0A4R0YTW6_9GAMM|nr:MULTISPECIES: class I SAM-dependent methyltransferase [Dyella]TBR39706.1 class I SAM-dependent methyltransferase [Dyella terrae]TCI12712.1 class I SAM-dependent methyltransferase [Dyella soli]
MTDLQSTERFSNRVDNYVRYRPDYPRAMLQWLEHEHGVNPRWLVADIGAGTGISSKLFLDGDYKVIAIEPNAAMRGAAERWLGHDEHFRSLDGRADATGLAAASVDLVSVAQAFHWFDQDAARHEFHRILRPHGLAAIYWNTRRLVGTPFLEGYEALLVEYGIDYTSVAERYGDDDMMRQWFGDGFRGSASFDHRQLLDYDALKGRLLSSSYMPTEGHPNHEPMLVALRKLFDATAQDGHISFDYDTRIFVGYPG